MDNCIELETLRKWKTTVNRWTHLVKTDENISESIKNKRDSTMPSKILSHQFEFKYSYPFKHHHVSFKAKMFKNAGPAKLGEPGGHGPPHTLFCQAKLNAALDFKISTEV